jgi:hypothetical protein
MADDHHTPPPPSGPGGHNEAHWGGIGGSPECLICPVCVILQALSSTRPEVSQHLLAAGRELALALKAGLESQAEAYDRAAERAGQSFRRINVD